MTKRFLFSISILLMTAMMFTLAGCGSSPAGSENSSDPGDSQGTGSTSDTGDISTTTPPPQRSKIMNIGTNAEAINTDPTGQRNATDGMYMAMHYESLVFSERSGRDFDPMLATSWEYNDDASEWTFYLREGVTFHNGEAFDADDVVSSFQYMLDNKDTSSQYLSNLTSLESVEKIDQYTVKLYCSSPTPLMLNSLLGIYMFPNELFEELGPEEAFSWENLCGTGPWIINEWISGQYTSWVKNDNYWNKDRYNSYFDEVRLSHLSEPSSVVAAHLAGDLDAYTPSAGMHPDLIPLYNNVKDRVEVFSVVTNSNNLISMQCGEKSLISDLNLRKAINHAIDRELMVQALHNGIGLPANSLFHPMTPGYDASLSEYYRYDPDLAKEFLAESAYDGRTLNIMTRTVTTRETNEALAVADMLAKIGIIAEVQPVDSMTFQTRSTEGDFDMIYTGTPIGNNEPGPQWNRFMTTVAKNNNFYDEIAFELMREYLVEPEREKRIALGTQIVRRLDEILAPYVFTIHPSTFYARNYGITGLNLTPDGGSVYAYVDWDPSYTAASGTSAPTYVNHFRMD